MSKITSLFERDEYKQYQATWDNRLRELYRRKSYYTGEVYTKLRTHLGFLAPRLYRGVKPLYLPLARAVDVDAGIIPNGWTLTEDATDAMRAAQTQLFDWSKWQVYGPLYVHFGAQYGVSALKVSDLREMGKVTVTPIDPTKLMLIGSPFADTADMAVFVEQRYDSEQYEYAEVITPDAVMTFRNGMPHPYDDRPEEYLNELGFVPYVEIRHIETGDELGECTYQKAIPMLDEVNQLASYLGDIIAKHAEPQWAVIGAEPSDLVRSGDNVWFIPGGGDAKALVAPVDVAGVLQFIQEIAKNVQDSLPELSFDELRQKTEIATATLELQLMELVLKVKRTRPNYDDGLTRAMRMAGLAAATMGVNELRPLNDTSLEINTDRPVLPMDPKTALEIETLELALSRERGMGEGLMNYDREMLNA